MRSQGEGYPRTPDSSEGLIPRATICYMGIDPYVMFFEHQDTKLEMGINIITPFHSDIYFRDQSL